MTRLNLTPLVKLFREREVNHVYRDEMMTRRDLPEASRIERTVFIKALRSVPYGDVMKVIDGIKGAGANTTDSRLTISTSGPYPFYSSSNSQSSAHSPPVSL